MTQAGLEKTFNEKAAFEELIKKKEDDIAELQKQVCHTIIVSGLSD